MNSFANSLFSLLFGWARTLIRQIWTSVMTGRLSGFFTWLGDHWLWFVLLICAACTAMDFLIWLVRWRPYLVWRTKLRSFRRWITGEARASAVRFEQGYEDGVGLAPSAEDEEALPQEDAWVQEDWTPPSQAPAWSQEQPASAWSQPQPAAVPPAYLPPWSAPRQGGFQNGYDPGAYGQPVNAYEAPLQESYDAAPSGDGIPAAEDAARQRMFTPASDYELPPIAPLTRVNSSFSSDMPAARRRRRSEKYEKRKPAWREKLIRNEDDEDRMLDGLPPAVDRDQAFYEPVYPQSAKSDGLYSWQRPSYPNQTDGNQA